ncbi:MAG: RluA family pseudouridine synthase [Gammaproteobacteria bacterium]|nr:RluA family pseudouridine synthase [Gammaproteobacteria bacterium]
MSTPPLLSILHEDPDLLVVNKPADLVCHPAKDGPLSCLVGRVRLHFAAEADGGTGADCHLVNRLDRETSGVVVVAKATGPARELRRLWEARRVRKEYLAIVHGHPAADRGRSDAPLGRDEASRVAIKDRVRPDGAVAGTDFEVLRRFARDGAPFSLLRVTPGTGRKHQIRIHLAHLGHPIVGDKLYGGDEDAYLALVERRLTAAHRERLILPWHALHAASVAFRWRDRDLCFTCEPEAWFSGFLPG